jgi:radical SAM protein with 4Fe4S-binding SPASM domain
LNQHPLDQVKRGPHACIWEITRRCNLRCLHCENECGDPSSRELSLEKTREVGRELATLGGRSVHITGGEPLLHPQWDSICRDLAGLGLRLSLVTNGTLLDHENLTRALDSGVVAFGISLDGLQTTHDSIRVRLGPGPSPWRQTVAAIERAGARAETIVITAVNRRNLAELPALCDHLIAMGVRRWQVQLVVPMGRVLESPVPLVIAPGDLEFLTAFLADARASRKPLQIDVTDTIGYFTERETRLRGSEGAPEFWTGCQAGIRAVAITYDGRVRGCSMLPPEFDAGDVHDEPLTTIWNDVERFAYSTRFSAANLSGPCGRCRVGPLCRAGCTTMAYWTTGSIYTNPFCLHRVRGACA